MAGECITDRRNDILLISSFLAKKEPLDVENEKDWTTFLQRASVKKVKLEVQVDLVDVEKRCLQVCPQSLVRFIQITVFFQDDNSDNDEPDIGGRDDDNTVRSFLMCLYAYTDR